MEYHASRVIDAAPESVWAALLDVSSWPGLDLGVTKVGGEARDGGKLKVFSEISPGRAFPVKVGLDSARRVMTWTGGMPFGLFKGVRTFSVAGQGSGTSFTMHEQFTGPLLGMMAKQMPDLQPTFDKFADGLKAHCEAGS